MRINIENDNSNMIKPADLSFIHVLVVVEGSIGKPWSVGVWE
jgi:hypothetical protein